MSEQHNLDSTVKNTSVYKYGTALFIGFTAAITVVVTGMNLLETGTSLFGLTLVSTDEIRQNENTRLKLKGTIEKLTREAEAPRAVTQGAATQRDRVGELESRIQALDSENAQLRLDLNAATKRADVVLTAKPSEGASATTPLHAEHQKPSIIQSSMPSRVADPAPDPTRKTLDLIAGAPTVLDQTLTITLNYTRSYGGQFVINGRKHSYQKVGDRIDVFKLVGKKCFLEIMALSPKTASPNTATLDYVCAEKG